MRILMEMAGTSELTPLAAENVSDVDGIETVPAIPARVVRDDLIAQKNVDVGATLTQITAANVTDSMRLLTSTSPGTGDLFEVGHLIPFGFAEVGDLGSR